MTKKMAVKVTEKKQRQLQFSLPLKKGMKPLFYALLSSLVIMLFWGAIHWWQSALPVNKILLNSAQGQVTATMIRNRLIDQEGNNKIAGMLAIDMQWVFDRIEEMPWVRQVKVKKIWPDTLYFEIQEKQPLVRLNDQLLLETGEIVDITQPELVQHLPLIQWQDATGFDIEDRMQVWKQFEQIQQTLKRHQKQMSGLAIQTSGHWQMVLSGETKLALGRKFQAQRLERLLKSWRKIKNAKNIESIDLRYSNGFAVKYKNEMTQPDKQTG